MLRSVTLLRGLAVASLMALTSYTASAQTVKRVLVEEFTGAWCGFCPDGALILEQLKEQYGDKVIVASIHNGDQMAIAEEETLAKTLGIPGYPGAFIQRQVFDGKIGVNRGSWATYVNQELQGTAPVDLTMEWDFTPATREVTITINATFEEAMMGDLRFNAYIVEDSVSGTGTGYDQVNYYQGQSGHPYGNAGNPILGYQHRHVVRRMLGGAWGTSGIIPSSVAADQTVSHTYTLTLPAQYDPAQVSIIGLVQEYNTAVTDRQILNAVEGKLYDKPARTQLATSDATFGAAASTEKFEAMYTVKNISKESITYVAEVKKSDRTPADWTAGITPDQMEFTVAAGETADVSLYLQLGSTLGIGDAMLVLTEKNNDEVLPVETKITAVSSDVERLNIVASDGELTHSIQADLVKSGRTDAVSLLVDEYNTVSDMLNNLKVVAFSGGQRGMLNNAMALELMQLLESGVGVLITGQVALPGIAFDNANHPFFDMIGTKWSEGNDISNVSDFTLMGKAGDPVSAGLIAPSKLIPGGFWIQSLQVDESVAVPMISLQSPANKVVGTRADLDKARVVVLGFNPSVIQTASFRESLIDKAMDWIEAFVPTPKPTLQSNIDLNNPINFGSVKVGETKEMTFEFSAANEAGLEIIEIADFSGNFGDYGLSIEGLPSSFPETPITLAQGETFTFKLRYAPTAVGNIDGARLSIETNDKNDPFFLPEVQGAATEGTTSVGEVSGNSGEFTLSAGPNPFVHSATVRYSLNSATAKAVRVAVYNELGSEVAVLVNSVVAPGEHTVSINGTGLSAGMYRVVMTVDGQTVSLPVVNVK